VRALLRGEHGRPLLFEASKALRGVQYGLVVSRTPPWLAPRHGTAASEAGFGAVEVLDRMRANGLQPLDTAGARARGVVSRAYGRVGSAALSRGETAQASLAFHRATRIAPSRAAAWTNLGVARWRAGQRRAALEATRRAVSIEPSRATPWVNLVRFLLASGDVQAARRAHRAARRAGVEDPRLGRLGQRLDVP
jgi:tetratricopeptide (TPR) repeat protein